MRSADEYHNRPSIADSTTTAGICLIALLLLMLGGYVWVLLGLPT